MRALVNEPLQLARPGTIESEPDPRGYAGGGEARAQRELHVQQRIEAASGEARAELAVGARAGLLVEDHELDVGQVTEQLVLEPSDQPGDAGPRPRVLDGADDRERVTDVSERGQTQHADRFERLNRGQGRHTLVGSGGAIVKNPFP